MKKLLFGISLLGMAATANIALADGWPKDITGTWVVTANILPSSPALVIKQTASATAQCQKIEGTIYGNNIQGFYCPSSGRIYFGRILNNQTIQVWSGNVSQEPAFPPPFSDKPIIGGTFAIISPVGSDTYGEYNFHAIKQ